MENLSYIDFNKKYTYSDYLTWNDDFRRELIDGFVYLMSAPKYIHQVVSKRIVEIFSLSDKIPGKFEVAYAPVDVKFSEFDVVQPDIVVCDKKKIYEEGIRGAPELIVEIYSPSTVKKDLNEKFNLYEKYGVKEYWFITPKESLQVYVLHDNGKYDRGIIYDCLKTPDAMVPVNIIKGLEIPLYEILQNKYFFET
jgi:Uma2 family endonuclease